MTKKFKLIDKIVRGEVGASWFWSSDIKEFIELIKEGLCYCKVSKFSKGMGKCNNCQKIDNLTGFNDEKEKNQECANCGKTRFNHSLNGLCLPRDRDRGAMFIPKEKEIKK